MCAYTYIPILYIKNVSEVNIVSLTSEVRQNLEEKLRALHKRAFEVMMRMSEEGKNLIRDLIESSYRMIYLGYIPAYYRARPSGITSQYIR